MSNETGETVSSRDENSCTGVDYSMSELDNEVFDEEEDIELNPRPSKYAALLTHDLHREGSNSPMIESDTSTEAEDEEDIMEFGERKMQKEPKHGIALNRSRKWKKKRMKKKKDGKQKADTNQQDLEEFVRELDQHEFKKKKRNERSRSGKRKNTVLNEPPANNLSNGLDQLLGINSSILLDEFELQKMTNCESLPSITQMGKIVKRRANWPEPSHLGFQMIVDEVHGRVKWFRFWHKESYQRQQQQFWRCYRHHSYQTILSDLLIQQNPHHLDSLLLVSELFQKESGDELRMEQSRDFIERGIFACEFFAAHPTFQSLSSDHRLDYSIAENRSFFLLLHRQMLNKMAAGRFRVALEFAKLLFSKDPDHDPLAVLLLIDSLAFRARCPNFLLDFYEHFANQKRLDLMPNFRFSMILMLRMLGQEDEAEKHLEEALIRFPFMLSQILDHLQIQADTSIDKNYYLNMLASYRETESLRQLIRIYLHHSGEFWREPGTLNWLEIATHRLLPRLDTRNAEMDEWAKKRKFLFVGFPENIARHCHLHRIPIAETLLEDSKLDLGPFPVTDPFPPKNGSQEYLPMDEIDAPNPNLSTGRGKRHYKEEKLSNGEGKRNMFISFLHSLMPQILEDYLFSLYRTLCHYFLRMRAQPVNVQTD